MGPHVRQGAAQSGGLHSVIYKAGGHEGECKVRNVGMLWLGAGMTCSCTLTKTFKGPPSTSAKSLMSFGPLPPAWMVRHVSGGILEANDKHGRLQQLQAHYETPNGHTV
jgi:hypothetical protein